jgi:hypothetical protein
MKSILLFIKLLAILLLIVAIDFLTSCENNKNDIPLNHTGIYSLQLNIKEIPNSNKLLADNLASFDTLDFTIFINQEWARFHENISKNFSVNWIDGHFTQGLKRHIADSKSMVVYVQNNSIIEKSDR